MEFAKNEKCELCGKISARRFECSYCKRKCCFSCRKGAKTAGKSKDKLCICKKCWMDNRTRMRYKKEAGEESAASQ